MEGESIPTQAEPVPQPEPQADWYLYITGSVRKPGVYRLPPDSRLFQLVDAAGGLDGFADRVAINLAEPLRDGQHVHVPHKGETQANNRKEALSRATEAVVLVPAPSTTAQNFGFRISDARQQQPNGLIDINRASEEALVRLRGIGPALARRIVEYRRQHGPFRSVEELVQVRGIGAAKVKGLRGQATVGP
ncbi:MAG: ComEA family DNA-binding protein [Fretibacterium sp.]|nr:ComEA family DNA-binding protein [Fretibacterium sp.]